MGKTVDNDTSKSVKSSKKKLDDLLTKVYQQSNFGKSYNTSGVNTMYFSECIFACDLFEIFYFANDVTMKEEIETCGCMPQTAYCTCCFYYLLDIV